MRLASLSQREIESLLAYTHICREHHQQVADDEPLVVLDWVGRRRVAELMSDHLWLWNRGIDGGGPQPELVRRVAHWLMKEPDPRGGGGAAPRVSAAASK
jgi:hypothetical protein